VSFVLPLFIPPSFYSPTISNHYSTSCSRNVRILADHPTPLTIPIQSAHQAFDILILPGGGPGAQTFCTYEPVLELIEAFRKEGKWVAAICAGTTALVESWKKFGKDTQRMARVTSHPSVENRIRNEGWEYASGSENDVVIDDEKKIITSRG
jgi:protein DJ-1